MKRLRAFIISKRNIEIAVLSISVLLLAYYGCFRWERAEEISYYGEIYQALTSGEFTENILHVNADKINFINVIENFITVLFSIVFSSLISCVLIEKRDKNSIYGEAFEDFCENSTVQVKLPEHANEMVSVSMAKEIKKQRIPDDLLQTVIRKTIMPERPYYYDKCTIDVVCTIQDGILVKTISKNIYIRSYDDSYIFGKDGPSFIIASQNGMVGKEKSIEVKSASICSQDGRSRPMAVPVNSLHVSTSDVQEQLSRKQGYVRNTRISYNGELKITNKYATKVSAEYITRVPVDDLTYVFRVPCACKNLQVRYRLEGMSEYAVSGNAFGFLDDANSTLNNHKNNELEFTFDDWVFQRDGVCIGMNKKKCQVCCDESALMTVAN